MHKKSGKRHLAKGLYRWHRRLGACAALFLVWILSSGLLLNHSEQLQLDKVNLQSPSLARWYHLDNQLPVATFLLGEHWLVDHQHSLWLDGKNVGSLSDPVIGATQTTNFLAVASTDELILLDNQGHQIDKLDGTSLPKLPMSTVGIACQGLTIKSGNQQWTTADGIEWQTCDEPIRTNPAIPLNKAQTETLGKALTPVVSVEKLLLDLHTGHFFGRAGVLFVDAVAIGLLFLALSGLWLFFRTGKKQRQQPNQI